MSETTMKYAALLQLLQKVNPKVRKSILKAADSGLIKSICECAQNTLKGHVTLNTSQKSKLRHHKKLLRKLVRKGDSWRKKKKIVQSGGAAFLPLLLSPIIGALLGNIFN